MSTYLPRRLSRPVALLVTLAMVGGMLVVMPNPIRAQDPASDYLAAFDACPEDVIPEAGFVDIPARHDNAQDIDCIAYYGITRGTGNNRYSPTRPVIREHMALFLIRLAELVGIYLPPAGATPFTDVADLSRESQQAISLIYQLGITVGTSPTTYTPGRNVSRGEMALFLQRLMDLMDVVADGRDVYGYTPDDVDDNDLDADLEAPWRDIASAPHGINEAVTELYELGVASGFGGSSRLYGPNQDMSRADMAAFMAAILDHSNLRPQGLNAQVTPKTGTDEFEIIGMISVRDGALAPVEDQAVDWFYTDDPDGGLARNGECDRSQILGDGDCEWDSDDDDETNRDGNVFVEFRATAGETMTLYAWIGDRDGDEFDEDSVRFSSAKAVSDKGPSSLLITHDIPEHAWQIGGEGGEYIVDMDRRSSVEITIQLQDESGVALEREGIAIDVEVESREIVVDAADVNGTSPAPSVENAGRTFSDSTTVLTDRDGEAVFELDGPTRDERRDIVTIETGCCSDEEIQIVWSRADSVLVAARPTFDLYQLVNRDNEVDFTVEYQLYDQYGNTLRGHTTRYTGRDEDVMTALNYQLVSAGLAGNNDFTLTVGVEQPTAPTTQWSRGRLRSSVETEALTTNTTGYFLVITPRICTTGATADQCAADDNDADRIDYAEDVVVWVVTEAGNRGDLVSDRAFDTSGFTGPALQEVELYEADRKFRTFYTIWDYDRNDRFQDADGETISIDRFEQLWMEQQITDVDQINVLIYGSGIKFFQIR